VKTDALCIVMVNYRTADLAIDCLRSLEPEIIENPGTRVVVVDNASGDGSVNRLNSALAEHGWGSWVSVLASERNGGFAAGNNLAIRAALNDSSPPHFVLLLNPDTLVRPGALKALVTFMERRLDVGLVGSRLEDPDGTPQPSAFRFPTVLGELDGGLRLGLMSRLLKRWVVVPPVPESPGPVDWVAGASLMVRREVFDAIGLLDEEYFMYFEEVDFCLRARRAGWPCWYLPESRVIHLVGQSSGVTASQNAQRRLPDYWFESRRRFFLVHYGRLRTTLADLAWAFGYALYRVRRVLQGKPKRDPEYLLWDFLRHNFFNFEVTDDGGRF
jgi:N-acetylglucosaminyl-diphospho-decaprenol L-rhamnosyltransferase